MNAINTTGIVLRRVNYGEADRIITFLTPDHGKVVAIAKGVRRTKSKLAGGIELFSISEISFIKGKSDIDTLTSSRLKKHFGNIVKDLDRSNAAYDFLKKVDRNTEDTPEPQYFMLLQKALSQLDEPDIDPRLIKIWFDAQLLKLAGHAPNLRTDSEGQKLQADDRFNFDFGTMTFEVSGDGTMSSGLVKFMRLLFSDNDPGILAKIESYQRLTQVSEPLVQNMLQLHLRV